MNVKELPCAICLASYIYDADDPDDAPDGYILPSGEWICDECGSCPECGRTLEKEPERRARNENGVVFQASPCRDCAG